MIEGEMLSTVVMTEHEELIRAIYAVKNILWWIALWAFIKIL